MPIRKAFSRLADIIDAKCPEGRDRSVAHAHLETAAMWAIRSVAHQGEPQNAK